MSQSQYNQVIPANSFTAGTAYEVSVPLYYERIIVTNQAAAAELYVTTNDTSASTNEGGFGAVVVPGAWRMVGNDQPKQPLVSKTAPGSTVQNTGYQGATVPNLNPLPGNPTTVTLLFPTGSAPGNVALEFV